MPSGSHPAPSPDCSLQPLPSGEESFSAPAPQGGPPPGAGLCLTCWSPSNSWFPCPFLEEVSEGGALGQGAETEAVTLQTASRWTRQPLSSGHAQTTAPVDPGIWERGRGRSPTPRGSAAPVLSPQGLAQARAGGPLRPRESPAVPASEERTPSRGGRLLSVSATSRRARGGGPGSRVASSVRPAFRKGPGVEDSRTETAAGRSSRAGAMGTLLSGGCRPARVTLEPEVPGQRAR